MKTDGVTDEDQWKVGNANWIQLFVAGSITKNISFFTEMQFDEGHFHFSWYKLRFHNLGGTTLGNVETGNLSPRDYGCYPNRLRIMGPVKGDIFLVKSSGGGTSTGENTSNMSSARPAIQYYGYKGPFMGWAGVSPGQKITTSSTGTDMNQELNYWGGLRMNLPGSMESNFEGSGVSIWALTGTDTADFAAATPTFENEYTRYSIETTIRYQAFELMAAYAMGKDDNWNLDGSNMGVDYNGVSLVAGYMSTLPNGKNLHYALQYDKVMSDDVASVEREFITPSVSYFPVENIRIGLYARIDTERSGDDAKHTAFMNVRTMF